MASYADNLNAARLTTQVPFGALESSREFGDYQFYMSFGGDQYFDLPASIDSNYGVLGQVTQVSNAFFTIPTQLAGYAAYGNG